MSNRMLTRFSVLLAVTAVFLFVSPRPTSADAADMITFHLSATAVCADQTTCGNNTITITGTFTLDPDQESSTNSLAALPTFSLVSSDGTVFSSAETFATSLVVDDNPVFPGQDLFGFETASGTILQLIVDENNVPDNASGDSSSPDFGSFATQTGLGDVFNITSLTLTPVSATPEPSSLSLLSLGAGLLGLAPFIRRKFAHA